MEKLRYSAAKELAHDYTPSVKSQDLNLGSQASESRLKLFCLSAIFSDISNNVYKQGIQVLQSF